MTWSYNPVKISTMPLYYVRMLIGDTKPGEQLLQDEEITALLTTRPSVYGAAADSCRAIASLFSRKADTVQGELRTMYSSQSRSYAARAQEYETQATKRGGGMPYAGGISVIDKLKQDANPDRVTPNFYVNMLDNQVPVGPIDPGSTGQDTSDNGA